MSFEEVRKLARGFNKKKTKTKKDKNKDKDEKKHEGAEIKEDTEERTLPQPHESVVTLDDDLGLSMSDPPADSPKPRLVPISGEVEQDTSYAKELSVGRKGKRRRHKNNPPDYGSHFFRYRTTGQCQPVEHYF